MERYECEHGFTFSCPICHKPQQDQARGYTRGREASAKDNAALRARVAELEENVKKAWEECHATSSALSKATQDRDRWRACAVYLDYRGADYCVAIHRELDGLQTDNAEHREQMSKLLTEWRDRATRAEAERDEARAESRELLTIAHMDGYHRGSQGLKALIINNTILRERVVKLKGERDEFLRAVQVMCDNESWWEDRLSRAEAEAKRYREALIQIDKHWRTVGGALSEHSAICKIARKALEGGE